MEDLIDTMLDVVVDMIYVGPSALPLPENTNTLPYLGGGPTSPNKSTFHVPISAHMASNTLNGMILVLFI